MSHGDRSRPAGTSPDAGAATAGFVTGLLGLVLCWIPALGLLLAVAGIVLSSLGMGRGSRNGLAIAGLVLGIIALFPGSVFTFLLVRASQV